MEIILALVVALSVIFFGALISLGNERQKRAIDGLREQVVLWVRQDISIKRRSLIQDLKFDNPQTWLSQIASKVCGTSLDLAIENTYKEPQAISCRQDGGIDKFLFSPISPSDIRHLKESKRHRLGQFIEGNPLFSLPKDVRVYELSTLNAGTFFDLEVDRLWFEMTGQTVQSQNHLWMYQYT